MQRIDWTPDQFVPYVTHQFADGTKEWLFDGFLFLEFADGKGSTYAYGYTKKQARKTEWEWLLDRIFEKGKALDALDQCIEQEKKEIGKPRFKHKVVLGVAIPLSKQKDWGSIDGTTLDFNRQADQIKAAQWYIDQLMSRFKKAKYKNLELSVLLGGRDIATWQKKGVPYCSFFGGGGWGGGGGGVGLSAVHAAGESGGGGQEKGILSDFPINWTAKDTCHLARQLSTHHATQQPTHIQLSRLPKHCNYLPIPRQLDRPKPETSSHASRPWLMELRMRQQGPL